MSYIWYISIKGFYHMKSHSGKKQGKTGNKKVNEGLKFLAHIIVEKILKDISPDNNPLDKDH